jgi:hypothetical protein
MKDRGKQMNRLKYIAAVATLLFASGATAQNAVTDWNNIAITQAKLSTAPGSATPGGTGVYVAYVELAVYNAVNAINGGFEPYKYTVTAPAGASADAAAIEAAYRMLRYLLPDRDMPAAGAQYGPLTQQYNTSLSAIPDGQAKTDGKSVGLDSANKLIQLRANDHRGGPRVPAYTFPGSVVPGVWIPTPPAFAQPQIPWLSQMQPFTFDDPGQFFPDEAPPDLSSQTWADDYNQVKALGAATNSTRTPKQTEIGLFWTDHTSTQYGRTLRELAAGQNLSLSDTSRLFAMAYAAHADALIGCWNAKYYFSFWRPVTAIRNGDLDGNPDTVADPSWTPLAATPGHPEYPSAHGCITGALADVLKAYFGTPHVTINVYSAITGTTSPHTFKDVRDWQNEVEFARIYAGFHYHHSLVQASVLGHKVARNLIENYFRPVR